MIKRQPEGRGLLGLRPVSFELGINRFAEGSALIKAGNTFVHCTASVEESVPGWRSGSGKGWVSAEYSMLPRSTHTRMRRDREKLSGRTQEIQRLIGRALRAIVDFEALGERSIFVDCDVIQADGGTRTASITGGCVALMMALLELEKSGKIKKRAFHDTVSAVSIGLKENTVLTDLDYVEDSSCDVDMNFVVTGAGDFVEVQGTAEGATFKKAQMDAMTDAALDATKSLREMQISALKEFFKVPGTI
jgi:ribonuclease PH